MATYGHSHCSWQGSLLHYSTRISRRLLVCRISHINVLDLLSPEGEIVAHQKKLASVSAIHRLAVNQSPEHVHKILSSLSTCNASATRSSSKPCSQWVCSMPIRLVLTRHQLLFESEYHGDTPRLDCPEDATNHKLRQTKRYPFQPRGKTKKCTYLCAPWHLWSVPYKDLLMLGTYVTCFVLILPFGCGTARLIVAA